MPTGTTDVWVESVTRSIRWGCAYFAMQAIAGFAWWTAVFVSPVVREATLGNLDPIAVAVFDIPLFVVASALAASGVRAAAVVSTSWTGVVAVALAVYATVTTEAGWGVLSMGAATAGSLIALCLVLLGRVPTAWIIGGPFAFRPASSRPKAATHVASTFGQIVLFWGFFLWWFRGHSVSRTALGLGPSLSTACRSCRCRSSRTRQRFWHLVGSSDVDAWRRHAVASGDAQPSGHRRSVPLDS